MSDDQQPEDLRPLPDGGLKDAMPGWLKRPPAWRSMPTAEQRHERTLPEPDTSEIDPKTLVDVTDLPQWLQTIAARGEVPLPEPDESVEHAIEQIQAASAKSRSAEVMAVDHAAPNLGVDESVAEASPEEPDTIPGTKDQEIGMLTDEPQSRRRTSLQWSQTSMFTAVIIFALGIALIFIALAVYFLY